MKFCAFDAEGRYDKDGVTSVAIWSDTTQQVYSDVYEALKVLQEHCRLGYVLVAHNAEYDISVLFWQYDQNVKIHYYNERFNHGEWCYDEDKPIGHIWDSLSLSGNLALKKIGKALQLPKYETPQKLLGVDISRYQWKCEKHDKWECEECYVLRDAEIVYAYMESYAAFLASYGVPPRRTMGSAAESLWRAIDQPEKIYLRRRDFAVLSRLSYFGGRVDTFKIGKFHNVYCADVFSMYPAVMRELEFPNPRTMDSMSTGDNSHSLLDMEGVSECDVYIPDQYIPPLPVSYDGKLYFPVGNVRGVWTHLELRYAIGRGARINRIYKSVYSPDTYNPFRGYIDYLMAAREEYKRIGDPRHLTVKIMANSLYGRLGLGEIQTHEVTFVMPDGTDFSDWPNHRPHKVGNDIQLTWSEDRKAAPAYANVLWASYVTAAARIKLLGYLEQQGSNILYCDTDSVFSLAPIQGLGTGLGALVDEEFYAEAWIIAPKMYRLQPLDGDPIVKAKGVPASVAERYLKGELVLWDAPVRPRESKQRHLPAGLWVAHQKQWRHRPAKRQLVQRNYRALGAESSDTVPILLEYSPEDGQHVPESDPDLD